MDHDWAIRYDPEQKAILFNHTHGFTALVCHHTIGNPFTTDRARRGIIAEAGAHLSQGVEGALFGDHEYGDRGHGGNAYH